MKGYFANRKMRGTLFLAACFFIAWNWAGCSAETLIVEGPPKFLNDVDMPNRSLAFGFIDTAGLQVSVEWVTFELFDTPAGSLSLKAHVKRGLFFPENLVPGSYRVASSGGHFRGKYCQRSLRCKYPVTYGLPPNLRIFRFKIEREGIFPLGAARATSPTVESEAPKSVNMQRISHPPEHEMIRQILPYAKGTAWFGRLEARLDMLKRENR